jgi:hypothetical protein
LEPGADGICPEPEPTPDDGDDEPGGCDCEQNLAGAASARNTSRIWLMLGLGVAGLSSRRRGLQSSRPSQSAS